MNEQRKRRPSLRRKKLAPKDVMDIAGRTWFGIERDGDCIRLSTRDNGSVYDETAGQLDITEGRRLLKEIRKWCPLDTRKSSLEVVDEWVHVDVSVEPRSKAEIAKIKADREADAKYDEIRGRLKSYCDDINEGLRGSLAATVGNNIRNTLQLGSGLDVKVVFGRRFLYGDHLGSRFAIKTVEEAEELVKDLVSRFPELEWREYQPFGGQSTRELRKNLTGNKRPPNNVIEEFGFIDMRATIRKD